MKKVSLKDIADELNLSKTTISWILTGKGEERGFSPSTIELVKQHARKVNYQPNLVARSLYTGKTNTIGLIIPAIGDTFYAQMAHAVEQEAYKYKNVLTISSSEGDGQREDLIIDNLISKQVDGIILAPSKRTNRGISRLIENNYPFVLIDRYFPDFSTRYIIVNNDESSFDLVHRLFLRGARKIALLFTEEHTRVMQMRFEGYRRALTTFNLPYSDSLRLSVDKGRWKEHTHELLDRLFLEIPDVDGFYFANHFLAMEAIRYFIQRGIDYNHRFQMACFHETEGLDMLAPQMLISRMPIEEMGSMSVKLLLDPDYTRKPIEQQQIVLPNKLVGYKENQ